MKIRPLVLLAALGVAPFASPAVAHRGTEARPGVEVTEERQVVLHIEGMTCGGCAISARVTLKRLDGVREAKVDYEKKQAWITYDPAKVTPQQMIQALKDKLGYTGRVVERAGR